MIDLLAKRTPLGAYNRKKFYALSADEFDTKWQYTVRICSIAFFLIPFKPVYLLVTKLSEIVDQIKVPREFPYEQLQPASIKVIESSLYYNKMERAVNQLWLIDLLGYVWILGTLCFFVYYLVCFIKFHNYIKKCSELTEGNFKQLIIQSLNEMKVKKKVEILQSEDFNTPFYTGIRHSKIILPSSIKVGEDIARLIINHEIYHLIHKDVLIKMICMLIKGIHWFNPIIYKLCDNMEIWCENYCDECVTNGVSRECKIQYALAILHTNLDINHSYITFNSSFHNSKINFKRRIYSVTKRFSINRISKPINVSF